MATSASPQTKTVALRGRPLVVGTPVTTRRYQGPSALAFAPDGGTLAFISGLGDTFDAWSIAVSGGDPEPLLSVPGANLSGLSWSPSGDLVASAHRGGTERWQVYVRRADGRVEDVSVSEGDAVQHLLSQGAASPDGRTVAYSTNARDPEDVDLAIADLATGERRAVAAGEAWHVAGYWSPDGRLLQVMRVEQNTDQTVLLFDLETGTLTELTPHDGEEQNVPAGWLADGRPLVITNQGREHLWLAAVDRDSGVRQAIDAPEWGIDLATSSADGLTQAWTVNEDGWNRLRWQRQGSPVHELEGLDGIVGDLVLSRDGRLAAFTYLPIGAPEELRLLDTETGEATTLLRVEDEPAVALRPESIRIPGPAGDIPAYVFRAAGAGPAPALLMIHGGPEGQSRPRLAASMAKYVDAGLTLVIPNIHGSTGYGKTWQTLIHRDWGGIDVEDFRALAEWMRADERIDSQRIGVYGGSYGGFAALSCVTRLPEYWRCGVALYAPCSLVTMLEDAEPNWRRWNRLWIGDLEKDRRRLVERSPLTHAEAVRCPMLLMSGANDPRIRKRESDVFVERMRALGREVEYLSFDGEGHGVTKPENVKAAGELVDRFLRRHLLGEDEVKIEEFGLRETPEELLREQHAAGQVIHDEMSPEDPRTPIEDELAQLRVLPSIIDGAMLFARGEGGLKGWATVTVQDIEGLRHIANVSISVLPDHRRQGIATALAARAAAAADRFGRELVQGSSKESVPAGEAFARSLGADLGQVQRESRLDLLALDRGLVRRWAEEGPRRAPGYSLRFVRGETPDEIMDEAVAVFNVMNTAPKDDLDRPEIQITPELLRMQEKLGSEVGMERWAYYAVEDATGRFVGFTDVVVKASEPEHVTQGNTAVDPEHRGNALGKWLKAAMAEKILEEAPQARSIVTGNAFSNAPMLGINDEMGFKASSALQVWQVPVERLKTNLNR